ncbi:MAG: DUF779 domain-containing protein [Vulcanimicrobiaceae bacterium]
MHNTNVPAAARVDLTPAAATLIEKLRSKHGPLMFHQSGGCCDGSSPMCYALGDFMLGSSDVKLGEIAGAPFYMSESQFEYWQHTKLIIDVVPGRGGMFSLENPEDLRFLTRSEMFSDDELGRLPPIEHCS